MDDHQTRPRGRQSPPGFQPERHEAQVEEDDARRTGPSAHADAGGIVRGNHGDGFEHTDAPKGPPRRFPTKPRTEVASREGRGDTRRRTARKRRQTRRGRLGKRRRRRRRRTPTRRRRRTDVARAPAETSASMTAEAADSLPPPPPRSAGARARETGGAPTCSPRASTSARAAAANEIAGEGEPRASPGRIARSSRRLFACARIRTNPGVTPPPRSLADSSRRSWSSSILSARP